MNESWENINITYNSISLRNNTVCEPYHIYAQLFFNSKTIVVPKE